MKQHYYINNIAQPDDYHDIHRDYCLFFDYLIDKEYLGKFETFVEALEKSKTLFTKTYACKNCIPESKNYVKIDFDE